MSIKFLDYIGKVQSWYGEYKEAIIKGFKENGKDIEIISNTNKVKDGDIVIIGHYENIQDNRLWYNTNIIKITHFHSCYTPWTLKNNEYLEKEILSREDYISIVNSTREKELLEKKYNTKVYMLGFPLFIKKLKGSSKKEKGTILSSGRFDKSKNIDLCYYFLSLLQKKGYKVKFCSSTDQIEKYQEGLYERYGVDTYFFDRKTFQEELSKSEYYFNTALPETLGIGAIEALVNNCYCILPKGSEYSYSDFYTGGYTPYSFKEIEYLLEHKPKYKVNIQKYNYSNFIEGLIQIINLYLNKKEGKRK